MNTPPKLHLLAVLLSLSISSSLATTPQALEMDKAGVISIVTDDLDGVRLIFGLTDTSEGYWRSPKVVPTFEPESGKEIERSGTYEFPDGSTVEEKTTVKLKGSDIEFKASWPNQSPATGFGMAALKFPPEIAEDLTIEVNGETKVVNFDKCVFFPEGKEVVFKKTSTGKFLFKVTGEQSGNAVMFQEDNKEAGLDLRMGGGALTTLISEITGQSCTISFKE
ncbi:MAG: hypothetical protein NTV93_13485 [Verrucomicrobia bacterium]|nr:hypothetical protein [Verrucomicrobiota bacterium]